MKTVFKYFSNKRFVKIWCKALSASWKQVKKTKNKRKIGCVICRYIFKGFIHFSQIVSVNLDQMHGGKSITSRSKINPTGTEKDFKNVTFCSAQTNRKQFNLSFNVLALHHLLYTSLFSTIAII